jgi:hypothetical protein
MCLSLIGDVRIRHGPAAASHAQPWGHDVDGVKACSTRPKEANAWLQQQNASGWLTEDMMRYSTEQ